MHPEVFGPCKGFFSFFDIHVKVHIKVIPANFLVNSVCGAGGYKEYS